MSTSVTLMATRGHCRKCQLISKEGFLAAETGQSPSLERQTFSRWNMPHSPDSPQIGQNAWSGLRQLANLENGVIFAAENVCLSKLASLRLSLRSLQSAASLHQSTWSYAHTAYLDQVSVPRRGARLPGRELQRAHSQRGH